jgi:hypothetical protein
MEKSSVFDFQAKYTPIDCSEGIVLNLKAKLNKTSNVKLSSDSKYILVVLDISGSMAGSPIETCKETLKKMFEYLHKELDNKKIDLLLFNRQTTYIPLRGEPLENCISKISSIKAEGGTAFIPVFNEIKKIVKANINEMKNLCIVFLSDGVGEKITELEPHLNELKIFFQENTKSCETHSLGFSRDHDAMFLTAVANAGTSQGTFQYIQSSSQIQGALDAVSGFFGQNSFGAFIKYPGIEKPSKIVFEESAVTPEGGGAGNSWDGFTFIDLSKEKFYEIKDSIELIVRQKDHEEYHKLSIEEGKIENDAARIKLNLQSINYDLKKFTQKLTTQKLSKEEGENLSTKINDYRKKLDDYTRDIFKIKIADREPLFNLISDLNEYISTFQNLIKSNFINQLSNEQIAQLNSMAYRDVTRKALLKKLDKRAHKSVPIINEAFEKVKEISSQIDTNALNEKYSELAEKVGTCVLTCYNFIEALADEDCLCLTFDIGRSEISIVDATRITIKKIFPTIISAKSFMDSIKYAVKSNHTASGGFDETSQGSILKGVSAENITAVLPLYICQEHWKVASLLMKPILGWDITLDPVGYNYFQKKVLPFLLLNKILDIKYENPSGEFSNRIYKFILETCVNIVKDDMEPSFQGTMKEDVIAIHENFLKDGSFRTADVVQSNMVHLSHIYVFTQMALIKAPSKEELTETLKYMVEEELRRKQTDWKPEKGQESLVALLNIDIPKFTKMVEVLETSLENDQIKESEEKKNQDSEASKTNLKDLFVVPAEEYLQNNDLSEMTEKQKEAFEEYNNLFKTFSKELFSWLNYFYPDDKIDLTQYDSLEKIGIDTSAKFLSLYIQNKIQSKNSDRKSAFSSGKHKNPYNEEEARKSLDNVYKHVILAKKKKTQMKAKVDIAGQDFVTQFAMTDCLDHAASLLQSNGLSLGSFQYLQNILRSQPENCNFVFEKLKMIRDKCYGHSNFHIDFTIRKRFMRKLWKTYVQEKNYFEWKELWFK